MKNLGDKLLKARTDMGVSIRDASEVTKLREDVIKNMESGNFNYNLAEIYKRGFLRLYATFLKLDVDAIMDEYTLASRTSSDASRRRVLASRMSQPQQEEAFSNTQEFGAPTSTTSRFDVDDEAEDKPASLLSDFSTKKMAVAIGGVLLAVVIIIMIVSSLVSKDIPEENQDIAMDANLQTQPVSATTASALNEVESQELVLALTALADTYVLVYPDLKTPDGKPSELFYTGPMQAGERREFRSKVPVMVRLTDAERIKIEKNGKVLDTKGAKGLQLFRIVSK